MRADRASQHLHVMIRMVSARLDSASEALWSHPHLAKVFPEYLFRLYYVGRATLTLMEASRERARLLAPDCPVAARLLPYLTRHMAEEKDHDEWLLQDLEALGTPRDTVLSRTPPGEVASLVGSLHYWALDHHPVAVLSYFLVAEGDPFTQEFLDEAATRAGLPKAGLRWFYRHAVLDREHGADVAELLDELPLTDAHLALLGSCLMCTVENMAVFMERVVRAADRIGASAPAAHALERA